ncbi:MAG: hypothetical protein OXN27_13340 [Candidatus Poribacteria bacterium]|nr:hypothetical protein [Candidatus Poribacteria bacterium]
MKTILILSILFSVIALPALGELSDADLNKIRLIVKEEVTDQLTPIKIEITEIKRRDIGTLKEGVARLDGRLTGIEKQVAHATNVTYGLIALIVVAIGIPAWYGRRDRDQDRKIEQLTQEIEMLKQQQIIRP